MPTITGSWPVASGGSSAVSGATYTNRTNIEGAATIAVGTANTTTANATQVSPAKNTNAVIELDFDLESVIANRLATITSVTFTVRAGTASTTTTNAQFQLDAYDLTTSEGVGTGLITYTATTYQDYSRTLNSLSVSPSNFRLRLAARRTGNTATTQTFDAVTITSITYSLDPLSLSDTISMSDASKNVVSNPSFEVDLTGWSDQNPSGGLTSSRSTTRANNGTASLKQINTSAGNDDCTYFWATVSPSTQYTLSAYVYVETFTGAAVLSRGLYMQAGGGLMEQYTTLDGSTPTGSWQRMTVTGTVPSGETLLQIRLYSPQGTIYWDGVQLELGSSATTYQDYGTNITVTLTPGGGGGTSWTKSLADTVTLSDTASKKPALAKSDSTTLSDAIAKKPKLNKSDSLSVIDGQWGTPDPPLAPGANYTVPAGTTVSTSSALLSALASSTPTNILVSDGSYTSASVVAPGAAHKVYAINAGNVTFDFGFQSGSVSGFELHGIRFNVSSTSKTLTPGILHTWSSASNWVVADCWFEGNLVNDIAWVSYDPTGHTAERLDIQNFKDCGLRWDNNGAFGTYTALSHQRVWDINVRNVYRGATMPTRGGADGTGEAGIWMGFKVLDGVKRIKARDMGWMALNLINSFNNTTVSHIDADDCYGWSPTGGSETGTGIYLERVTSSVIIEYFAIGCETGHVKTCINGEWNHGSGSAAMTNTTVRYGTCGRTSPNALLANGVFCDEGSSTVDIHDVKFVGMGRTCIGYYLSSGVTFSNNDYSQRGGTAVRVSTDSANTASPTETVFSDGPSLGGAIQKAMGLNKGDTITLSDSLGRTWSINRTAADSVTLTDAIGKSVKLSKADSLTLSDSLTASIILLLQLADSVTLSDAVAKAAKLTKADTTTLSDAAAKASKLTKSDSVSLADSYMKAARLSKADVLSLSDALGKSLVIRKSDALTLVDDLAKAFGVAKSDLVSLSDAIDVQGGSSALVINLADTITLVDDAVRALSGDFIVEGGTRLARRIVLTKFGFY